MTWTEVQSFCNYTCAESAQLGDGVMRKKDFFVVKAHTLTSIPVTKIAHFGCVLFAKPS